MSLQREGYRSVSGLPHRERGKRKPTEVLAVNEQYALMITGFPLFHGFTLDGARMLLDCGEVKEYRTDEVLFKEGDSPTFVLLVLTGKMQVFVERQPRDLLLTDAGPGTILGELAVLCGIPRSASVRASEKSAILQWSALAFRSLLLRDAFLSERIFRESMRTLIEKEQSLIDSLIRSQGGTKQSE
jgi:CRP-like cAMP-binding protein